MSAVSTAEEGPAGAKPPGPTHPDARKPTTPSEQMVKVLQEAGERVLPTPQAKARLDNAASRLLQRAHQVAKKRSAEGHLAFEPILVGSAAKNTWLPGNVDLDVFLLYDPGVARDRLEAEGLAAGKEILDEVSLRYAEHPYVVGPFEGYQADIVPAYKVESGERIQSSVDRTPFHNAWVQQRIADRPELTTQIRLMKAWLRGVGVYGAKTAVRGISGYLAEVLTIHGRGFLPTLDLMKDFARGTRIDPTGKGSAGDPTQPLVVMDPVDPSRNAAAAVRLDRLERLAQAAGEFLAVPSIRFFEPAPLVPPRIQTARRVLGEGGLFVVHFPPPRMREDAMDPHLERAASTLSRQLERIGFDIERSWGGILDDGNSAIAVLAKSDRLPRSRIHMGPPVGIDDRREEFLAKYAKHPDAMEPPFETDWQGKRHLAVRLRERQRGLDEQIAKTLERVSLGKHIDKALKTQAAILDLEAALAEPAVAKIVAGLLIRRPPWLRQGHPETDYVATKQASQRPRASA